MPTLISNLGWAAALAAAAALGALDAYLAYVAGPGAALLLPVGAVVAVAVMRQPVVGACLAVLSIPLEQLGLPLGSAGLSPMELLLLLTAVAVLIRASLGAPLWPVPVLQRAGLLGLLVVAAGLLVAENGAAVGKAVFMWAAFLIVSLWISRSTPGQIRALLLCMVISGGVVAALAVGAGGAQTLVRGGAEATGRATATFSHPNVLAFFLTLVIPPGVVLAISSRGWQRPATAICTLASIGGLMLTLSRGSILGTAAALGTIFLVWPAFRKLVGGLLLLLAILAALNFDAIANSPQVDVVGKRLATIGSSSSRSTDPRFDIWRESTEIFSDSPVLGIGYGNFGPVSRRHGLVDSEREPYEHAHSIPLNVLAEGGIAGFAALLLFAVAIGREALLALRRRDAPWWPLAAGITASLVGLAVIGITDFPLVSNVSSAVALLQAAALVGLRSSDSAPEAVTGAAADAQGT